MVRWGWGVCVSPLGWKWSLTPPPHTHKTGVSGGIFGMVLAPPGTAVCQPKYTDCRHSKRTRLRWSGLSLIPSRHDAPAWAPKDFRDLGWWGMRSYDWTWGDENLSILFYVYKVAEGGSVLEEWGSEKGGLGWMLTEWMWQMKTSWEGDKARGGVPVKRSRSMLHVGPWLGRGELSRDLGEWGLRRREGAVLCQWHLDRLVSI